MSEQDAAYLGDKVVRQSQGAGAAKDLAAVQRGTEFAKLAVMFYSYASAFYNRQATLARDIGGAVRGGDTKDFPRLLARARSEEHTSELQSLMRISYAVFCLKKKNKYITQNSKRAKQGKEE